MQFIFFLSNAVVRGTKFTGVVRSYRINGEGMRQSEYVCGHSEEN
jgi:hypothetical protein